MALRYLSILILESIALSNQVLKVKLQVLGATFELRVDLEHVNLVKFLGPKLNVLIVKLVKIFL